MINMQVSVAMSGGVDSSVAAALCAKEYGKENVFGVTMRLFCYAEREMKQTSCCSIEAINDAKAVCQKLGIKHYVLDFEKEFEKEIVNNFVSEYLAGKTPNPCIRCNQIIKFNYLLKKVMSLGADFLATGHYARRMAPTRIDADLKRITTDQRYKLLKGKDQEKDQSYFLYTLNQKQLRHLLFPLGELTKTEVRKLAKELGLKTAEKVESQDICFITNADYRGFIKTRISADQDADKRGYVSRTREGEITDFKGNVLGKHGGLAFYTIGQRKGLGISSKNPLYVVDLNIKKNQLIVGQEKDLYKKELLAAKVSWIAGIEPKMPFKAKSKIRYGAKEAECVVKRYNGAYQILFTKPQRAITPGQSVVFYIKDEVLGGGII